MASFDSDCYPANFIFRCQNWCTISSILLFRIVFSSLFIFVLFLFLLDSLKYEYADQILNVKRVILLLNNFCSIGAIEIL